MPKIDDDLRAEFEAFQAWRTSQGAVARTKSTIGTMWAEWFDGLPSRMQVGRKAHARWVVAKFPFKGDMLALGDLVPSECTPAVLSTWQTFVSHGRSAITGKPLSAGTADQVRLSLSAMFSHYVRMEELPGNPLRRVPRLPGRKRERQGYYNASELEQLARALPVPAGTILRHCFACGARRDNIRLLRKSQIDWAAGDLIVTGKGSKPLRIVAPAWMLEELRHLCALSRSEWVYPNPRNPSTPLPAVTLHGQLARARKALGMTLAGEAPNIHHARHGHAVDLLERGASLTDVQAQLGHAHITETARYAKMRDRMRDRLRGLMNKPAEKGREVGAPPGRRRGEG